MGKHYETPHKAVINPHLNAHMCRLSDPIHCGSFKPAGECWFAFLFCFTTEIMLLYFSEILCCFSTDFVTVAEIIRVLSRNPKPDGDHLLETDILDSIFVQIWPAQLKAISPLNYYQIGKFPFLKSISNDLLSVSNNGLFFICKRTKHLSPGHMTSWLSLGFSDLSVKGAVTDVSFKKNVLSYYKSQASEGTVDSFLLSSFTIRFTQTSNWISHWKTWRRKETISPQSDVDE